MMNEETKQPKTGYQLILQKTLSEQEAAHALGIEKNTLAEIRRKNGISFRRITRTKVVYHVDDIFGYLDKKKCNASFVSDKL